MRVKGLVQHLGIVIPTVVAGSRSNMFTKTLTGRIQSIPSILIISGFYKSTSLSLEQDYGQSVGSTEDLTTFSSFWVALFRLSTLNQQRLDLSLVRELNNSNKSFRYTRLPSLIFCHFGTCGNVCEALLKRALQ